MIGPTDAPERIAELYRLGAVRSPHVTLYDCRGPGALAVSDARHLKGKLVLKAMKGF